MDPRPPEGTQLSQPSLARSFRHAWDGLVFTASHQRSMKIHLVAGIWVALIASAVPLALAEKVTLLFCVLLVLHAEILNASLEALVDLHTEKVHPSARITKDAAAAGVLVLAIGSVIIFFVLLVENAHYLATHRFAIARQAIVGLPLGILAGLLLSSGRRPRSLDYALTIIGLLLLILAATFTASLIFTAVAAGLFGLAARVALGRPR